MAKVIPIAAVATLRGKLGDVYYRTTPRGEICLCRMPQKRTKRFTPKELSHQQLFGKIAKQISEIMSSPHLRAAFELWHKQAHLPRETMRQFLFRQLRVANQ